MAPQKNTLIVSSPEFIEEGSIPVKFTCKGEGINPTLTIDQVPEGTQSMALIMEDPDTAKGTFTHWVLFDIQPANSIGENSSQGVSGLNGHGKMGYTPPCPPSGVHRYLFHVYALKDSLTLKPGADRSAVEKAMDGHVLASGTLMARYGAGIEAGKGSGPEGSQAVGNEGKQEDRTTVDETGAGTWTTDKKVQH
jgi:Raf kinase inhibitor-like YbhB/YbcL family protein